MYPNPYTVLEVSRSASNQEITKAFAQAMKQKKYRVEVIAQARKSLINSEERLIADYLCPILTEIKRFKTSDLSLLNSTEPVLELIKYFDDLEGELNQPEKINCLKQKIGLSLFDDSNNEQ